MELAALANGASGHAHGLRYDTQLSTTPDRTFGLLTHPTVPALPAALALAGARRVHPAFSFSRRFCVGFEVECKIAEAIDPDHYNRGFHSDRDDRHVRAARRRLPKLLKQNSATIARTRSRIAVEPERRHPRQLRIDDQAASTPARAGAERRHSRPTLAADGFTGGDDGLDGQWGSSRCCGGGADQTRIAGVLGRPFTIVNPGVSVKPYPCGSLEPSEHGRDAASSSSITTSEPEPDAGDPRCGPARTSSSRCATRRRRPSSRRSSACRS
mgnify:CR=1 FL=1